MNLLHSLHVFGLSNSDSDSDNTPGSSVALQETPLHGVISPTFWPVVLRNEKNTQRSQIGTRMRAASLVAVSNDV